MFDIKLVTKRSEQIFEGKCRVKLGWRRCVNWPLWEYLDNEWDSSPQDAYRTCLQKDDSIGKYSSRPLVIVNNAGDFYFMFKNISNLYITFLDYVIFGDELEWVKI